MLASTLGLDSTSLFALGSMCCLFVIVMLTVLLIYLNRWKAESVAGMKTSLWKTVGGKGSKQEVLHKLRRAVALSAAYTIEVDDEGKGHIVLLSDDVSMNRFTTNNRPLQCKVFYPLTLTPKGASGSEWEVGIGLQFEYSVRRKHADFLHKKLVALISAALQDEKS